MYAVLLVLPLSDPSFWLIFLKVAGLTRLIMPMVLHPTTDSSLTLASQCQFLASLQRPIARVRRPPSSDSSSLSSCKTSRNKARTSLQVITFLLQVYRCSELRNLSSFSYCLVSCESTVFR